MFHPLRRFNLSVFAAFAIFLFASATLAQFQPMRLPSGSFTVSGENPTTLPAFCIDERLDTPQKDNFYHGSSESISVTRIQGGTESPPKPLIKALDDWLQISGNDDITSVNVTPKTNEPGVTYRITVDSNSPGVIADQPRDIAPLVTILRQHQSALNRLDAFAAALKAIVGEHDRVVSDFNRRKIGLEWDIIASKYPAAIDAKVDSFLKGFSTTLGGAPGTTPQQRLQHLTFLNEELFSDRQISDLQKLGVPIASQYDKDFPAGFTEVLQYRIKLSELFGEESRYSADYYYDLRSDLLRNDKASALTEASESAKRRLKEGILYTLRDVKRGEGARDVISLFYGRQFTEPQIRFLNDLLDLDLGGPTGKLDKTLLIKPGYPFRGITLNTTTSSRTVQMSELSADILRTLKPKYSRIVVLGGIDDALAAKLSAAGIGFVGRYDELARNPLPTPKRIKFFILTSLKPAIAGQLFQGQNPASIRRATELAQKIPNSEIIENREQYEKAVASLKPDERGVVVFHDAHGRVMLDNPISVAELAAKSDGISCSLYTQANIRYPSTHDLDFQTAVEAIAATANPENKPVDMNEFMTAFHENYEKQSALKKLMRRALIVGGAIGASGVIYIVHVIAGSIGEDINRGHDQELAGTEPLEIGPPKRNRN